MQDEPLGMTPFTEGENLDPDSGAFRAAPKATTTTGDKWQPYQRQSDSRPRADRVFPTGEPGPDDRWRSGGGNGGGRALRYATAADEKESEIETPLGNLNWSFLRSRFCGPFSNREGEIRGFGGNSEGRRRSVAQARR